MIFRTCKSGKPKSHVRHVKPVFMRVYKNLRTCRTSRTLPFYLTAFLTDRQEVEAQRLREEYENNHTIKTIRKLVQQGGGHWEGTASDIIDASRYFAGCQIHEDAAKVGKQLRKYTQQLHDLDAIIYSVGSSRADGKRVLTFASNNPFTVPSVPSVLTVPSVPSVPNTETGQTNT